MTGRSDFTRFPRGGGLADDPLDGNCSRSWGRAASKPVPSSAPRPAAPPPTRTARSPRPSRAPTCHPAAPTCTGMAGSKSGEAGRAPQNRSPESAAREPLAAPQGSAPPPCRLPSAARGPRPPSPAPPAAAPGRGPPAHARLPSAQAPPAAPAAPPPPSPRQPIEAVEGRDGSAVVRPPRPMRERAGPGGGAPGPCHARVRVKTGVPSAKQSFFVNRLQRRGVKTAAAAGSSSFAADAVSRAPRTDAQPPLGTQSPSRARALRLAGPGPAERRRLSLCAAGGFPTAPLPPASAPRLRPPPPPPWAAGAATAAGCCACCC